MAGSARASCRPRAARLGTWLAAGVAIAEDEEGGCEGGAEEVEAAPPLAVSRMRCLYSDRLTLRFCRLLALLAAPGESGACAAPDTKDDEDDESDISGPSGRPQSARGSGCGSATASATVLPVESLARAGRLSGSCRSGF